MSGDIALFSEADIYQGDPLKPDLINVTPPEIVSSLTGPQRTQRVVALIQQAHEIVDRAIAEHAEGKSVVAQCVLYSGGNDSTVLAHLMRHRATHAAHANTTIGIEQTRQFVRDTCAQWGLPLIERTPPVSYRDLVLERGFPGPAMHFKMFQRLKERPLRQIQRELISNSRKERIIFIAGRRRAESTRRAAIPLDERIGSVVWASPLAMWTKLDMNTYRLMHRDTDPVPVNEVSELIHMSGECLCGAFAHPGELEELRMWFPDVAQEIDQLAADVKAAGHAEPFCTWGHGKGKPTVKTGQLCTSCNMLDFEEAA